MQIKKSGFLYLLLAKPFLVDVTRKLGLLLFIADRWFFGKLKQNKAETWLMQPFNQYGSYLVRDSKTMPGDYSLSI